MGGSRGNFNQFPPGQSLSLRSALPVGYLPGLLSSVKAFIIKVIPNYLQNRLDVKMGSETGRAFSKPNFLLLHSR